MMRNKSAAFSNAAAALSQLGTPENLPSLRAAGIFVKRFILGGSHSVVTYPPLNALRARSQNAIQVRYRSEANLYLHVAFCETLCTFCHYAVRSYRGKAHGSERQTEAVVRYLDALKKEIKDWGARFRETGTAVRSIYIGGGTPLILEEYQLADLLELAQREFRVLPGAEICVEGSPLTITAEDGPAKLRALKALGATRLSFGVQSFDDEVLRLAARGYRKETALRACEIADEVFKHWNLDLIQSLRKGGPEEVWGNIEALRSVCPPHITWYHGRFANRPQGDWYQDVEKRADFESEQATLLGRMLIWEELASLGYGQEDGNRFVRDGQFVDPFKRSRTSVSDDVLGLGASSYSHVGTGMEGLFFRNEPNVEDYVRLIEAGKSPAAAEFKLDAGEHLAASYVIGLRTARVDPENEPNGHYRALVDRFSSLGLLERSGTTLALTRLGRLFEDEVLSSFYSPRVQSLLV